MAADPIAALKRRTLRQVASVGTSDQGRAACANRVELFDRLAKLGGPTSTDLREAASVCATCAATETCAFRVKIGRAR